jgi:hypothetical protein
MLLEQLKNSKSSTDLESKKGLNLRIGNVVMIYLELGTKDVLNLQKPIEIAFSMCEPKTLSSEEVLTPISSSSLRHDSGISLKLFQAYQCKIFRLLT